MKFDLPDRLVRREIGDRRSFSGVPGLYSDPEFVQDLDIVNELEGHSGCVNALRQASTLRIWSRSGRLLASGSDDKFINIHSYLPDQGALQFGLAATLDTGHTANIFSVKFMPNSSDSTIVSCAGDDEVRVFDIQRATQPTNSRLYLSSNSTNGKVFRSHDSSVKRIVTEASSFYFLTCSEDGEVRQWDIRQPESSYPRKSPVFRRSGAQPSRSDAPPPLITYEPYNVELWTISCSPSQPHYIALGGTHLHCFLHDRRMLGRNRLEERGGSVPRSLSPEAAETVLSDATRCVAKFAPYGQPQMSRNDSGKNISACKLGTANPNELIVSWMRDNIYSFDIRKDMKDQDRQAFSTSAPIPQARSRNSSSGKKRKRPMINAESPSNGPNSRPRTSNAVAPTPLNANAAYSFIVQMGGVPVTIRPSSRTQGASSGVPDSGSSHAHRIRSLKNSLGRTHFQHDPAQRREEIFDILQASVNAFDKIDDHISSRTYPVTTCSTSVDYELKLRNDRAKVWRYTQASGTLARILLGYKSTAPGPTNSRTQSIDLESYDIIRPAEREGSQPLDRHEQFGYDFIKAILLWLESGVGAVLREFSSESQFAARASRRRLPVPRDAGIEALDTHLIPYLEGLAAELPIVYSGHGGLGDDPRNTDEIFPSEKQAVRAFGRIMKIPFADLHAPSKESSDEPAGPTLSRDIAVTFWGHRVCMAVLHRAAIDVNYAFVATAFENSAARRPRRESSVIATLPTRQPLVDQDDAEDDEEDEEEDFIDHDEGDSESESDREDTQSSSADESEEDMDTFTQGYRQKSRVAANVPTGSHLRKYVGHCNVDTTKDVNFYGLNDEYVVSGSDCGNLFIWDKKTSRLVNILQGDNEVVNVVQPHPYEPMLAVSGIDSTVKIFSPDAHARRAARHASGISRVDPSQFSSIRSRRRRNQNRAATTDRGTQHNDSSSAGPEEAEEEVSDSDSEYVYPNGLPSRKRMQDEYKITSENDMNRRSGNNHQYISRGFLEMLAARMQDGAAEEAPEDCVVM
ncbi:WD40 repeat-like protein [Microthyrium microscopicum]|uniref:WD40 repeat-like protein n=1 Tax=Microthyrium microscopicum TaxID=703497 RepID=A0A6A6TYE8_9PEZI|nr:WD40 repeat-like protein [Microthyrium microscopicum]